MLYNYTYMASVGVKGLTGLHATAAAAGIIIITISINDEY